VAPLLAVAAFFWWSRPLRSDNFVFYLPNSSEVLPIRTFGSNAYLPLLRVLNLVGKVDALKEDRKKLSVWFGNTKLELSAGSRKVVVGKAAVTLPGEVRVEDGQWLVPAEFLSFVLPRIVTQPITYRPGDHRIFIGSTKPSTYAVRLEPIPNGTRLVIDFSDPVSFQTAARNGKWILYLGNRPFEPLEQTIRFDNAYIHDLQFDDQDGIPKLILTPSGSGMDLFPTITEGGKVLRADLLKSGAPVAEERTPAQSEGITASDIPSGQGQTEGVIPPSGLPAVSSLPVIALDAGHGGDNIGARGANGVDEKSLNAQIVVRVRNALLATGKYRVILTRVGDTDPGFDQRALLASTNRAIAFVSFHAGDLGFRSPRIVVYTYQAPGESEPQALGPRPLFVPWNSAQTFYLKESKRFAQALQGEFSHIPGVISGNPEEAPVRVLQSVGAPAVAVEIGSLAPNVDPSALVSPDFQRGLSEAAVRALDIFIRRPS
jgi:N-acetylmuramoyl-L-alanine amidase